jgi:HPt (histidine-containing phosphotransfer) domain-containing protein
MRDFVGKPIELAQIDAVLARVAEERGVVRTPESVLAPAAIAALRQIDDPAGPDLFARLVGLFTTETQRRLPTMTSALARGDADALADEAHVLRSASATLGATAMSELCGRIEAAALTGRIDALPAVLAALTREYAAVQRALVHELATVTPRVAEVA